MGPLAGCVHRPRRRRRRVVTAAEDKLAAELQRIANGEYARAAHNGQGSADSAVSAPKLGASNGWADTVSLDHVLPAFPVDALPPVLRDWVDALATSMQVPPDLPALLSLSALGLAVSNRYAVRCRPGWVEPLNLYTACLLASGTRKSPTFRAVIAPLQDAEWDLQQASKPDRMQAAQARRIAQQEMDAAERKAARDRSSENLADAEQARVRLQGIGDPTQPPCLLLDDITPEALNMHLAEQQGHGGMFSDEGGVFATFLGRYAKGVANLDSVCKAYDGSPINVRRVGREPIQVDRPALTFGLAIQPSVLASIADKHPEIRDRGLLARFLFAVPDMTNGDVRIGHRKIDPAPIPDGVRDRYWRLVKGSAVSADSAPGLEGSGSADFVPYKAISNICYLSELTLSLAAGETFRQWQEELERRRRPDGNLAGIQEFALKIDGLTLRLAGLLHIAAVSTLPTSEQNQQKQQNPLPSSVVEVRTMQAAITILRYAIPHARAVDGLAGGSPDTLEARAILDWVRAGHHETFTVRDVLTARRQFKDADQVRNACEVLAAYGWVRLVDLPPSSEPKKPGRPAGPHYEVNPAAFNAVTRGRLA